MTATKIQPGDDLHLTSLMAPHSLNFVTGADREALLAFGRDVFAAARASQCLAQIEEPAQPIAGYRISIPGDPELGFWFSETPCPEGYLSEPLYTGAAPAAVSPQGEYPQLPEAVVWSVSGKDGMPTLGTGWMFSTVQQGNATLPLFTADQLRAYYDLGRQAAPALEAPEASLRDAAANALAALERTQHASDADRLAAADQLRAALAAAPQAPAAPVGLPWRTGIPPWTDDRSVRVIAVTAHDDFGGVQVHDIRASDFHTDGDGDGAEVARVCTHWAYRDDIWPRANAAAPAAPSIEAELMKALRDLVNALRERHYGRMPEEVQAAYDKAWAIVFAAPAAAPAAPAVDSSDTALLDAMERERIAVIPEFEGPWDAQIFGEDETTLACGSGATPREAIAEALASLEARKAHDAAQAAAKGEHGNG